LQIFDYLRQCLQGKLWFPFGELILCSGFFLIFLIEATVHKMFNIQSHSHGLPTGMGGKKIRKS